MSYGNVTRMTGLFSGMDTEAMINQMLQAESNKLNNYKKKVTYLGWQQDAYRSIRTSLENFQKTYTKVTGQLSMNKPSSLRAKKAMITNLSGAVTGGLSVTNAKKDGVYEVEVMELADATRYKSNAVQGQVSGSFSASSVTAGNSMKITLDGVTRTITLSAQNIADYTFNGSDAQALADELNKELEKAFGYDYPDGVNGTKTPKIQFSVSGNDLTLETGVTHTATVVSNDIIRGIEAGDTTAFSTELTLQEIFGVTVAGNTGTLTVNGEDFAFGSNTSLQELMDKVNEADVGVTMSYNSKTGQIVFEGTETGYGNHFEISDDQWGSGGLLEKMGMAQNGSTNNAVFTDRARDAVVEFDGIQVVRETNEFEYDGNTWKITDKAKGEIFNVEISQDVDGIKELIMGFVDAYNELITELNTWTNTKVAKYNGSKYEPLLDEEKEGMTESEIAKWEEKAKEGLLYRDNLINSLTSQMRSIMYSSVELSDGSKLGIYQLGITTTEYKTGEADLRGTLQIDEDKLTAMIEKYGDDLVTLFTDSEQGVIQKLENLMEDYSKTAYGQLAQKAGTKGGVTEYENNIYRQIKNYNEKIDYQYNRLKNREAYYYNMFTRMEMAMAQADSQMNYLYSVFGG